MITNFQQKLYKYITDCLHETGCSPTYTQMIAAMGISSTSLSLINRSLRALEKDGKIVLRKEGRRILISLYEKRLTLLGKISAGSPIEALPDPQFIEHDWLFDASHFALKVNGTSMIEENICHDDLIICKNTQCVNEGDIVVALIDHQNVTLKRVSFKVNGFITLIPANKELKPRAYAAERILIQGVFVGLIRKAV